MYLARSAISAISRTYRVVYNNIEARIISEKPYTCVYISSKKIIDIYEKREMALSRALMYTTLRNTQEEADPGSTTLRFLLFK